MNDRVDAPVARAELLRRVDESWRTVRAAVRGLGRQRMGEKTPVGWTYKDLVAHVAAWETHAVGALERHRAGTLKLMTDADVDAFNARVVESRRLVGPEAVLAELDAAHRTLRETVARLPDPIEDQKVVSIVTANSFGHYAEHASELGL